MSQQRSVQVNREIAATPEMVFRALTHPLELAFWFSHNAWTDPKPGGEFLVRWRNGWWARGVYHAIESPSRVELTWQGMDEPDETLLVFEIHRLEEGTEVTVVHSGFGPEPVWDKAVAEAESSWPPALENLESVLTEGIDLRAVSTPVIGAIPEALTVERAIQDELAVDTGIYLATVVENGSAAAAGLRAGDVITSIGGLAVTDIDSLLTTLARFGVGETVSVRYVRGKERRFAEMELAARQIPEIPSNPDKVVAAARERWNSNIDALRDALAGVPAEIVTHRPTGDTWSVAEILAHLSVNERFLHHRLANTISGATQGQANEDPTALPELLAATLASAPTVERLLEQLQDDVEQTLAIFGALRPEVVAIKARYRAMAELLLVDFHVQDHLAQIRATVDALT
jgi:uncharacterized protein YndB with AHSA1/START domain